VGLTVWLCSVLPPSLQVKSPKLATWPGPNPACPGEHGVTVNNKENSRSQTLDGQTREKLGPLPRTSFSQCLSCLLTVEQLRWSQQRHEPEEPKPVCSWDMV